MKKIFIVHRWEGGANDDWRPWLKSELEKNGHEVHSLEMPDTDTPVIEKWVGHLTKNVIVPDSNTYFVGHSIGCQAILRYLETISTPVGGAVFVAGWFNLENLEDDEVKSIAKPWIETSISFEKIKSVLPQSTLIISDNDPFGAFEFNKQHFFKLVSDIVVVPGAGHFDEEGGWKTLPQALEALNKMFK